MSSASFSLSCCKISWFIVSNVTQNSTEVSVEAVATAQSSLEGSLVDSPSLPITIGKLDGANYLTWLRSASLSISSRGLFVI